MFHIGVLHLGVGAAIPGGYRRSQLNRTAPDAQASGATAGELQEAPLGAVPGPRIQGLYSGNRDPDSTRFGGTSDIDDFVVFDLYGEVDLPKGQLELGIKNLFNADYTLVINQAYDSNFAYARAPETTVSLAYSVDF